MPAAAPHISYDLISRAAGAEGLAIYGAFHPARSPAQELDGGTLVLLGTGPDSWPLFMQSEEYADGGPDPLDRWSERAVDALAARFCAAAHFPFGGPPYTPFVNWALASGRAFTSPSQMLVHDRFGMMVSYRGALHFTQEFTIPEPPLAQSPCATCADKPCLSACPAGALAEGGPYRTDACHAYLDTPDGASCMSRGCLARRACPLSTLAKRRFAQSAHHMRYFHPR